MKSWLKLIALGLCLAAYPAYATMTTATSVRTDYTVTPVTTVTPLTIVASMPLPVSRVQAFDSSGKTMKLQVILGGETTSVLIPPGGADLPLKIAQGSVVKLIAVSGTASSGESDINFFY